MSKHSKLFVTCRIVAGSVAAGLLIGWLGGHWGSPPTVEIRAIPTATEPSSPERPAQVNMTHQSIPPAATTVNAVSTPNGEQFTSGASVITNWEDRVNEILGSQAGDTNKIQQLYGLFPRLPDEGQMEVAQHLSNLVSDKDYVPLGQLLKNAQLHEPVLDTLIADVLGRPNSLKLPVLLAIAQNPVHVKNTQAKELLGHSLDGDYGDDWPTWKQKMEAWLKNHPD